MRGPCRASATDLGWDCELKVADSRKRLNDEREVAASLKNSHNRSSRKSERHGRR